MDEGPAGVQEQHAIRAVLVRRERRRSRLGCRWTSSSTRSWPRCRRSSGAGAAPLA